MKQAKSVRNMIILIIVVVVVFVSILQVGVSFFNRNNHINTEVNESLRILAQKESSYMYNAFSRWGGVSELFATTIGALPGFDTDIILSILEKHMIEDELIVGGGFWLEPFQYSATEKYHGPFMFRDGDEIAVTWEYSSAEGNYFQYDWYQDGFKLDKPVIWSEPYADSITGVPMITATTAIQKNGKKVGVTTLDIGLDELQNYLYNIKVGEEGFVFIVTDAGYYIAHKDDSKNLVKKITEEEDEALRTLGNSILERNNEEIIEIEIDGVNYFSSFAPIGDTGLNFVLFLPVSEAVVAVNRTFIINILMSLFTGVILVIVLSYLVGKIVIKPLKIIANKATDIGEGDLINQGRLTNLSEESNEIGILAKSFIKMIESMKKLISGIVDSSDSAASSIEVVDNIASDVTESFNQISATINDVAEGISEQASSTQEGHAKINEISSKLSKITKNTKHCNLMTQDALELIAENSGKFEQQKAKMKESIDASMKVSKAIKNLASKTNEIEDIASSIEGIAEQTNLLALNAAIEAARAGDAGSGFAVVADEVRKLATQSTSATQKINGLISEIQTGIKTAEDEMGRAGAVVEEQNKAVDETVSAFGEITKKVDTASLTLNEISDETVVLNESASEVVKTMENLANIAEENSAATEEIAASTEQSLENMNNIGSEVSALVESMSTLRSSISRFKIK